MASTYVFCPMVLGLTGRPLEVMQMLSEVSCGISASPPRPPASRTYRTFCSPSCSPRLMSWSSPPMARTALATASGSPVTFRSLSRLRMLTA